LLLKKKDDIVYTAPVLKCGFLPCRDVLDVQLILMCSSDEKITYTTKLMMYNSEHETPSPCKRPRACSSVAAWNKVTALKPERQAILIGKDKLLDAVPS
jgi:hypothetical protein